MEVTELIEQMRQANPNLLEGIPADKAAALLKSVFRHINETLAGTADGVVQYEGLGRFRIRKVEKEKAGEKTTRTRIGFRVLEPGEGKGGGKRRREGAAGARRGGADGARRRGKGRRKRAGNDTGA